MKKLFTLVFALGSFVSQAQVFDTSLAHTGHSVSPALPQANCIGQQSDGSIIAGVNNNTGVTLCKITAGGIPDTTYGTGGMSTLIVGTCLTYGPTGNVINDIAIQSDDMAIGVGYGTYPYGGLCGYPNMLMFRMKSNGTPDSSFGGCGMIQSSMVLTSYPLNLTYSHLLRIKLLPDGKFLVLGYGKVSGSYIVYTLIMRFNGDGTLDTTFGTGGICTTNVFTNEYGNWWGITVDGAGNMIVAGTSYMSGGGYSFYSQAIRITSAGVVDSTFGTGGVVNMTYGSLNVITAVEQRPDGKYVVIGSDGISGNLTVLNTDGTIDSVTVPGGYDTIAAPGYSVNNITSFYIQPDNKLVLAGYGMNGYNACAYIARLNENGTYDATFNGTGIDSFNYGVYTHWQSGTFLNDIKHVCGNRVLAAGGINQSTSSVAQGMFVVKLKMDDTSSCSSVTPPTGISQVAGQKNGMLVYPNPAYDEITIENATPNSTYRIFNTMGQIVFSGSIDFAKQSINLLRLSTGSYTMQITDVNGSRWTWKISKL